MNYFAGVIPGSGAAAKQESRVTIRYTLYADRQFTTRLPGVKPPRALQFTIGQGQFGAGLDAAVQGMKAGGKRRVFMHEEVATSIAKALGGVQPGTQFAMEIELLKSEH